MDKISEPSALGVLTVSRDLPSLLTPPQTCMATQDYRVMVVYHTCMPAKDYQCTELNSQCIKWLEKNGGIFFLWTTWFGTFTETSGTWILRLGRGEGRVQQWTARSSMSPAPFSVVLHSSGKDFVRKSMSLAQKEWTWENTCSSF